ncbi:MAG: branched-chain amino acid transport system II carrier protein [Oscillospiraceae bacterium]
MIFKKIGAIMNNKLSMSRLIYLSCMLFSIFFGAGNMIFPPMLGQMSGTKAPIAWLGFCVTGVGVAILGVISVSLAGTRLDDLASFAGRRTGLFITVAIYMLIGHFFALPRTGSVSFELGILPFIPSEMSSFFPLAIYSFIFFALTLLVSLKPQKIVDILGKCLTPILLISIIIIFVMAVINPVGTPTAPTGDYDKIPFFKGLIEGYLTLDGFAGLVFSITVANSLRMFGITEKKALLKYTLLTGGIAGGLMMAVYAMLCYVGGQVSGFEVFNNGGALLTSVTGTLLGSGGKIVLAIAVILACFTTSVGLTTSVSEFLSTKFPRFSYRNVAIANTAFSFIISNIGLSTMINLVLPLLIILYPVVTVMVFLSLFNGFFENRPEIYWFSMLGALSISLFDGFKTAGIQLGGLTEAVLSIPLGNLGIGWIIPTIIGFVIGVSPIGRAFSKLVCKNIKAK